VSRSALEQAVRREIAQVDERLPGVAESWRAQLAIVLARETARSGDESLSGRVSAARRLTETMTSLGQLDSEAPAEKDADRLDELGTRRRKRIGSSS